MVFYKVLSGEGCSCHGGSLKWSLPTKNDDGSWSPGEWMPEIVGPLVECRNGYHLVTLEQLPLWLDERIFVAEVDGEVVKVEAGDKWIGRRVRLVRETAWDDRKARLFACDCGEHVLHIYERAYPYPTDGRPRAAIETARLYANGRATQEELAAAGAAARDAVWDASKVAEWDSAGVAAEAAAEAALAAAKDAAWEAALAAATCAARAAALAAAWEAELEWQSNRLAEYLEVR